MSNYIVVIPSYKRPQLIKTHTLKVLENYKISLKKIFIFVANKTEYKDYYESLDKKYHKNITVFIQIIFKQIGNYINIDFV